MIQASLPRVAGDEQEDRQDKGFVCCVSPERGALPHPVSRREAADWPGRAVRARRPRERGLSHPPRSR